MTTTTTTPRITKAMKFDALAAAIQGNPIPHDLSIDDLLAFIDKEKALLSKKNSADRKPTATQVENEGHKERIMEFLTFRDGPATCADILKGVPEFADFQNQKIAALANALVRDGKLVKSIVKGRSMFMVAAGE